MYGRLEELDWVSIEELSSSDREERESSESWEVEVKGDMTMREAAVAVGVVLV